MIVRLEGRSMNIHPRARIAANATLVGAVTVGENASIWYGAVLRADNGPIVIGEGTSIQDNCVLHETVTVGKNCVVGHGATLHGCTIEENALIGMGSTVLDGAVIGRGAVVAAGALVTGGTVVPPGCMAMGVPARIRGEVTPEQLEKTRSIAAHYIANGAALLPCGADI